MGIGSAGVQGDSVQDVASQLGTHEDEPYLGAVAVGDDHLPALLDHIGDVDTGLPSGGELVGHRLVVFIFDQRIAPDGYYGYLGHMLPLSP